MFKRLFWILVGVALAFWLFKMDPELKILHQAKFWLLEMLKKFKAQI
ncbi:MAG: hypothetical protein WC371_02085 [Parachlamydiales bacterium]|jgi:hypothetical protein